MKEVSDELYNEIIEVLEAVARGRCCSRSSYEDCNGDEAGWWEFHRRAKDILQVLENKCCATCNNPTVEGLCYDVEGENFGGATTITAGFFCGNWVPRK